MLESMTPDQAKYLLDFTLPTLENECKTTAKVLAAAPNAHLDYKPSDKCMAAGDLVWHIASADMSFLDGIVAGAFGKGPERPANTETPQQVAAWYSQQTSAVIAKLKAFTPDESARILDFHGMFQYPAAGFVTFMIGHSIHHRGQLSSYIRPMGGKVPSIYGPSADENPFADKASA